MLLYNLVIFRFKPWALNYRLVCLSIGVHRQSLICCNAVAAAEDRLQVSFVGNGRDISEVVLGSTLLAPVFATVASRAWHGHWRPQLFLLQR